MTMVRVREFTDYIDALGNVYHLHVPSAIGRWLISQSGWGTPPIDYLTERSPFQHGETVVDYFLRPRVVQLLIRQNFCNREDYWSGRAALLDGIRPNRQLTPTAILPGTLRRTLADGSYRSLDCYIQDGPQFAPSQVGKWDEFSFQEVLRFIAYNPVIYDPTEQTQVFATVGSQLVFPITFPIVFSGLELSATIAYVGTWLEYPIITITGPLSGVSITNETTGEILMLAAALSVGQSVIIDLSYGAKTVLRNDGVSLIGSLSPESDLATWHLAPDPEAPGGLNDISVTATGSSGATSVTIAYKHRYFGV